MLLLLSTAFLAMVPPSFKQQEMNPSDTEKIIQEGKFENESLEQLTYLATKIGPRVTGSPQLMAADNWAVKVMKKYGLKNVHLEQWGIVPNSFYRGPDSKGAIVAPFQKDIVFSTSNWTLGTKGAISGPAIIEPKTLDEVHKLGPKLEGAWILMDKRVGMTGAVLAKNDVQAALDEAGIAGRLYSTNSELVWSHGGYRNFDYAKLSPIPQLSIRKSDFDAMYDPASKGSPVTVKINVDNRFTGKPQPVYNVVGDYPGTELPDQVVVVGGHFDSWNTPGSQGAMDNGTGSMIALEVARIIKHTGVAHKRTLRVILYSGEEEGLLGSKGYVEAHEKELDQIVAVLNDDEGTNAETGFAMLPGAESWLAELPPVVNAAFPKMPINITTTPRLDTGGSDHGSFINGGVPAINFGKAPGPVSYGFIWHTQNDRIENVSSEGLVQSSTCSALTAYLFLNSSHTLPRPPAKTAATK